MRFKYSLFVIALLMLAFCWPAGAQELDSLVVPWSQDEVNPTINVLRDTILADTLPDGSRNPDRVYVLQKGGYYWNEDRIDFSGIEHLRIVGQTPDPNDPVFGNPATIQIRSRADQSVDDKVIVGSGSLTLKNLYFIGCDETGVQTYYQPLQFSSTGKRFHIENCIFERTNFSYMAWTNPDNDIYITGCVFRNLTGKPSTQQWEGRGTSMWIDQDSVIIENNTYFNLQSFVFQLEGGAGNYVRFVHNTMVNIGRNINAGNWWKEAYFANNLVVNGFWHGEGFSDVTDPNRAEGSWTSGIFSIGQLPSKYGPEQGRRIVFANTAAWRDPAFAAYYADSIRAQPILGSLSAVDYVDVYDAMVVTDTQWVDPGLNTTFDATQLNKMTKNINDLRNGITPAEDYMWMIPQLSGGQGDCYVCPSWPLPEDFSYTNASLMTAGTDGLPLGDLNWFPSYLDDWNMNHDQYVTQIENMAGEKKGYLITETLEAEDGTLGGDAEIKEFSGFSYFQMDGGGFMEWRFNLDTGGQYDLNILTNMRGNDIRGQRVIVNGVSLHDCFGWGEYIWDAVYSGDEPCENPQNGMSINDWAWTKIIQDEINEAGALTLVAGENTIRIESSWGWQNFAQIEVLQAGTETVDYLCTVPNAYDFDLVTPIGEGAPFTPSGFKKVALNTTGTITWNATAPADGTYRLRVFYQNYDGEVTANLSVGGSMVATVPLESEPDSTGLDILTDSFSMTQGANSIELAGNQANIDYIQVIQEVSLSIRNRHVIPDGFALEQNYPNPFNPTTTINFSLGKAADVKLIIYNVLGQRVATLINNPMRAGSYSVEFDGSHLATGVYFYRLKAGDFVAQKKLVLIK